MRCKVFLVMTITNQFLFGMFGAYSIAKKSMEEDLGFTENTFGNLCVDVGIGEMLSMVARVVITTYLTLVPPKTLIFTYLGFTVIQFLGY